MNNEIMKNVAKLNAISDIASRLSDEDVVYDRLSKVTKRIAELKMCGLTTKTIKVILHQEGLLSDEEFSKLLSTGS